MTIPNAFISHQIYLQRLASKEAGDVAPFIKLMRNEIRSRVLEFGDDNRTKPRLQAMLRDMEDVLYGITGDWDDQLIADLKDLSIYESKWTTETLNKNVDANFTSPSPEQVWAAIRFEPMALSEKPNDFSKWLADWSPVEVSRLVQGVKLGFVQGQTTRDIVKKVVGAGSLIDVSERNAKTIVRTAVAHVSNVAREAVYDKNSDIVEGYEWVSTLDSRTSTICRSRDGHVYLMTDKFKPKPPAHPNCRSTTIPKIDDSFDFLDVGAKRAAKGADGGTQVSADMTYYDFLKTQPAWFQDEALGPTRGKIFRNAGMTPDEFRQASVDGFGRPLTLKQMAAADQKVADYLYGGD